MVTVVATAMSVVLRVDVDQCEFRYRGASRRGSSVVCVSMRGVDDAGSLCKGGGGCSERRVG